MPQYAHVFFSADIQVIFQHDFILCQCSGFICTKDVHSAEILNRIQVFNNGFLFAHGDCSFGKTCRYNHRKHFRCQPDCNGNPEKKSFQPVPFCNSVKNKDKRNHNEHESDQDPRNCIYAFRKACLGRLFGHGSRHGSKQRMVPGTDHNRGSAS